MYSCGPPLMDVQEWDDQHELTYSSYVRTRVVILKTCRRRWMIGRNGERRSGISAQAARHDDDGIYIYDSGLSQQHQHKVKRKHHPGFEQELLISFSMVITFMISTSNFPSHRVVAKSRLKNPVYPTIYSQLRRRDEFMPFPQGH